MSTPSQCTLSLYIIVHWFIRFQVPNGTGKAAAPSYFSLLGGARRVDGARLLATSPTDSGAASGAGQRSQKK